MEPEKKPLRDPKLFETNHKHQNILLEGEGDNLTIPSYKCPICGESSIALAQLNRHIDDLHNLGSESYSDNSTADAKRNTDSERARNRSGAVKATPPKRILRLSLDEDNSRFSLSESSVTASTEPPKLTHALSHPSMKTSKACAEQSCKNLINVRDGVVHCRNCGKLFCDAHPKHRARLSNNSKGLSIKTSRPVYDSVHGTWANVCHGCYMAKPGVLSGTKIKINDLTTEFAAKRDVDIEKRLRERNSISARFLRLTDLHSKSYLRHKKQRKIPFLGSFFDKEQILEAEKQIVGVENWQPDEEVSHCKLCFAKFGLLTRKHHCRLCGSVVDDGSFTENTPARLCSAQVPLSLLMEKLPQLNYSPIVKSNWDILISAGGVEASHSRDFSVRVCKTCKDSLLHSKHDSRVDLPENIDVLSAYDEILAVKATIISSLARYQNLIQENKEAYNNQVNRLRSRLRKAVKDLEIMVNAFLNRFFAIDAQSKRLTPTHSAKLVTNIYKASSVFLQDSILQFKRLNEEFQKVEHQKLAGQLGASTRAESCTQHSSPLSATMSLNISSRLTKKQIRELREQLMVTNEQKFIIESLIEDVKRQRKFDELTTLEGNRKELACRIAELTDELGEYGF
ncbi:hypothetical protein OXX69_009934 [Metschnikowia pulcherrima]